jgi:hypothetical protein
MHGELTLGRIYRKVLGESQQKAPKESLVASESIRC